jgi:hypothetical protein
VRPSPRNFPSADPRQAVRAEGLLPGLNDCLSSNYLSRISTRFEVLRLPATDTLAKFELRKAALSVIVPRVLPLDHSGLSRPAS